MEEARKLLGLPPAEVDEDGKENSPHIQQYKKSISWIPFSILSEREQASKDQSIWAHEKGAMKAQADGYRKGACKDCTGVAGTEAVEVATDLRKANIARKVATED